MHDTAGDGSAARWAWSQVQRIFDAIDHPRGAPVRARLRLYGERQAVAPPGRPPGPRAGALAQPVCG